MKIGPKTDLNYLPNKQDNPNKSNKDRSSEKVSFPSKENDVDLSLTHKGRSFHKNLPSELSIKFKSILKNNNPDDPVVSKKILDALNMNFINFNQKERDTLASILMTKAEEVKKKT